MLKKEAETHSTEPQRVVEITKRCEYHALTRERCHRPCAAGRIRLVHYRFRISHKRGYLYAE